MGVLGESQRKGKISGQADRKEKESMDMLEEQSEEQRGRGEAERGNLIEN